MEKIALFVMGTVTVIISLIGIVVEAFDNVCSILGAASK